jgi:acetolactate synthase regulatory subunit
LGAAFFVSIFKQEHAVSNQFADLELELDNQNGALERMLGVIRVRGFEVQYLLVNQTHEGFELKVRLRNLKQGSPSFTHLQQNLDKQMSVIKCRILLVEDVAENLAKSPISLESECV